MLHIVALVIRATADRWDREMRDVVGLDDLRRTLSVGRVWCGVGGLVAPGEMKA